MKTKRYIRTRTWQEGQYSRLEGGYEQDTEVTLIDRDDVPTIVLGNPQWDRTEIKLEDLYEFLGVAVREKANEERLTERAERARVGGR